MPKKLPQTLIDKVKEFANYSPSQYNYGVDAEELNEKVAEMNAQENTAEDLLNNDEQQDLTAYYLYCWYVYDKNPNLYADQRSKLQQNSQYTLQKLNVDPAEMQDFYAEMDQYCKENKVQITRRLPVEEKKFDGFHVINKETRDLVKEYAQTFEENGFMEAVKKSKMNQLLSPEQYQGLYPAGNTEHAAAIFAYLFTRRDPAIKGMAATPEEYLYSFNIPGEEVKELDKMLYDKTLDWEKYDIAEKKVAGEPNPNYEKRGVNSVSWEGEIYCPLANKMWGTVTAAKGNGKSVYRQIKNSLEEADIESKKAFYAVLKSRQNARDREEPTGIFNRIANFFRSQRETRLMNHIGEDLEKRGVDLEKDVQLGKSLQYADKVFQFARNEAEIKQEYNTLNNEEPEVFAEAPESPITEQNLAEHIEKDIEINQLDNEPLINLNQGEVQREMEKSEP